MDDRGRHVGLYLVLGFVAAMAGCVTIGRPLPESYSRPGDTARLRAPAGDVPLVPIPSPPLGRTEESATASIARPVVSSEKGPITLVSSKAGEPIKPAATKTSETTSRGASTDSPAVVPTARQLLQAAQTKYATIDSYIVRLTRRELVKDKINPDEVMLFKFRKQPWSVYLKWLSKHGQGREVVYIKGQYENKIHTLLAAGDIPFMPAGRRMALAPDNILVRTSTRHPITNAGIGASIEGIAFLLRATEGGDRKQGKVQIVGPVTRDEFDRPAFGIEHTLPAGLDPTLPQGGRRTYFFHPDNQMPALIIAKDERGREVEYYHYDRLQPAVKLDDDDFNPERLWDKPTARAVGR